MTSNFLSSNYFRIIRKIFLKPCAFLLLMIVFPITLFSSEISVENLKANVGENLFFSWQINSELRNQHQLAYQIQLASNENFEAGKLIWDSGKITSNRSVMVPVNTSMLKPGVTYYWRVCVWNQDEISSDWSNVSAFRTELKDADWKKAKWIGFEDLAPEKRMVPGVHGFGDKLGDKCKDRPVVPMFRKEFEVKREVKEAILYITGLGQYEAYINGEKVGNDFLTPGWTNYDKTVLYNSYDVSSMLRKGKNAIGAIVGNGFYNINRERYRKLVIAWGNPKLIGQLRIRFTDGSEKVIATGNDWKTAPSPVTFASIYGGEDYDAQLEQQGWNLPAFNDAAWKRALLVTPPSGRMKEEKATKLELKENFTPQRITKLDDGNYLYDFGQNASAIVALKVKGRKGQVVRLIPSELITRENHANQSASGSPYYFSYTLKGDGVETWQPRFTYYGFRYVVVIGAAPADVNESDKAQLIELKMLHNRNATQSTGTFSCSYDLFNRTFNLINWGIKSNLQSVLTDCPHREKLGWLEQTFLMGSAVHYNFNLFDLYTKQVNDMIEAQLSNGLVPDIAPEYVPFEGGFRDSPEWGSAAVILPWMVYQWYGDTTLMKKAWPMMERYVEYLKTKSTNHILSHGLGDWFDYGPRQPGEAQLTPKALTATSIYYYDVKLLAQMAAILKNNKQQYFEKWAEEIKVAFNNRFFNPQTCVISTGSQTAMAMPWCVGLVDDQYKPRILQNLEDSVRAQGKPLTAGDVGFHYLVEALTGGGKSQLLYEMNARDDVPGYGFQLRKGATALTESWPALENVSNNHLMLGHLMDWFYAGLGGIRQGEESVAYKEIVIKPEMVGDISWVKCNYQSPYGMIQCNWEKAETAVKVNVTIPANTTATVYIPVKPGCKISESSKDIPECSEIRVIGEENGFLRVKIGSGVYSFEII